MQVISLLRRIATLLIFSVAVFIPIYSQNNTRSMLDADTSSVLAVAQMISDTFGAPVDLVAEFIAQAKKLEIREGIPATAFIGIAILESTGFTSYLYQNARNPFGMRATAPWRGATFVMWHEGRDAPFRKYSTPAEAVRDFNRFLESRKWFRDALACSPSDVDCFLDGLVANPDKQEPGYATDPGWGDKIRRIIAKYHLETLVTN